MSIAVLMLIYFTTNVLSSSIIVNTPNGQIMGQTLGTHDEFRGIPFAVPPVGNRRWLPPLPVASWAPNIINATVDPPGCFQNCTLPAGLCPTVVSEDCLYLNLFRPSQSNVSGLPVMVFIPGGQFERGAASCPLYDGRFLVNYGVIVVVLNYRLGALGWMYTDGLSPNLGFLDQRMAMKWVQNNIKFFGGDPTQVTLFGESAGGSSVTAHLMSPPSQSLFQKAIVQSNPITLPYKDLGTAKDVAAQFLSNVTCTIGPNLLSCLQKLPLNEILTAQNAVGSWLPLTHPLQAGMPFIPVVDGTDIPSNALDAFLNGKFSKIPIIWGSTTEEGVMFAYLASKSPLTDLAYSAALLAIFQNQFFTVGKLYPGIEGDNRPILSELITDYIFNCPNRYFAQRIFNQTGSTVPIFLYVFNHTLSFNPWGKNYAFCDGHVCHGSELAFVFNTVSLAGFNMTSQEIKLAQEMNTYWTNFAKSGVPNSPIKPPVNWPEIGSTVGSPTLLFGQAADLTVPTDYRSFFCDHWDDIGYTFGTK